MAYRKFYRSSKPSIRNIAAKFSSQCICCGGTIRRGDYVTYYPAGSIAGVNEGKVGHLGGLEGNSSVCCNTLKNRVDTSTNDFAGDGLDARYEDDCRNICGL